MDWVQYYADAQLSGGGTGNNAPKPSNDNLQAQRQSNAAIRKTMRELYEDPWVWQSDIAMVGDTLRFQSHKMVKMVGTLTL